MTFKGTKETCPNWEDDESNKLSINWRTWKKYSASGVKDPSFDSSSFQGTCFEICGKGKYIENGECRSCPNDFYDTSDPSNVNSKYENAICVREDLTLGDKMENVSVKNSNLISNMSLKKRNDTKFKAYGLAKINRKSFEQNIKYFYNLSEKIRNNENYYGLIRNNLKKNDYHIIRSNKYNLAEINNHDDLKVCLFNN